MIGKASRALEEYRDDMLNGRFPPAEHSYHIDEEELSKVK
jgi:ketopantoate hydroxymethyltransferase